MSLARIRCVVGRIKSDQPRATQIEIQDVLLFKLVLKVFYIIFEYELQNQINVSCFKLKKQGQAPAGNRTRIFRWTCAGLFVYMSHMGWYTVLSICLTTTYKNA